MSSMNAPRACSASWGTPTHREQLASGLQNSCSCYLDTHSVYNPDPLLPILSSSLPENTHQPRPEGTSVAQLLAL